MGPTDVSDDDVVAVVGNRRFTAGALMALVECQREVTTAAGGGELLLRFYPDAPETVGLPYPYDGLALRGMSHVPAAAMVISILHTVARDDDTFLAIAALPGGADIVYLGTSTGPLQAMPGGLRQLPLMHLVMSRIAWGHAAPADGCVTVADWLLRMALNEVADELVAQQVADGKENALRTEQLLRESLARLLSVLRDAEATTVLPPIPADWSELSESFALLDRLDWDDLNAEWFAEARGYDPEEGTWWTSRGIAALQVIDVPEVLDALDRIEADRPLITSLLRRAVDAFAQRFAEVGALSRAPVRSRWHADDPKLLVRLVRKVVADTGFRTGMAVIGYRRSAGRLEPVRVFRDPAGAYAGDLVGIDSVGPADGIVVVTNSEGVWRAIALNRENEHGVTRSSLVGGGLEFQAPLFDGELAAMLRRILTGRAQADAVCAPHEWAYRRVLYGLARTLETGSLDGEEEEDPPSGEDESVSDDAEAEADKPSLPEFIDATLGFLVWRHVGTLIAAMSDDRNLTVVPDEPLIGEARWVVFAEIFELLRLLGWPDLEVAPLAEAWEVPAERAQWWGADGLGLLQARRIPEATESLMRCAFVLGRAPEGSAVITHLLARTKQVFGDDIAVLWNLLRDFDT